MIDLPKVLDLRSCLGGILWILNIPLKMLKRWAKVLGLNLVAWKFLIPGKEEFVFPTWAIDMYLSDFFFTFWVWKLWWSVLEPGFGISISEMPRMGWSNKKLYNHEYTKCGWLPHETLRSILKSEDWGMPQEWPTNISGNGDALQVDTFLV